ncbi:Os01g0316800 [Oryza sativa Japonica Group]|uniref:Os01g0316800 protein n=3 Tax=Oryza TaxID=4527 RepID=B7E359_ORYSJ|nr:hypothetical protein EE612_002147 [Oryza sativa]KAF2949865.1 hypothetical protein DAI22_01g148200 [Oryza sativa Japonica Group]KAF2949866.1 hypothetical protein DAI22_01g148200 [Oryza sativa Japonica Group]BAG86806.1 unnamed protein product [Oryza sativa Japonica Group]BAG99791.1 unnamed protein product [Oryza sativa Japonica Group]
MRRRRRPRWTCSRTTTSSRSLRSTKNGMTRKKATRQFSNGRMTGMTMMSMTTSLCSSGKSWRASHRRTRTCGLVFSTFR